jgi:IS5 family transposase
VRGDHGFRVIKNPWGFRKTRLRGMLENCCKVNLPVTLTKLRLARRQFLEAK